MSRLIDADALEAKMNLAIAMLKRTMKNFDIEDDPECQMELKAYQDIRDGIRDEPTIEPEPQWIPVSEPPKKPDSYPKCEIRRTYYLVSLESGCVESLGYEFDRNEWQITGSPVVAWMPLPEPYKEES